MKSTQLREEVGVFLQALREKIMEGFLSLESTHDFQRKPWHYQKGSGGGEIGLLRGEVFEKAAVNFSAVSGDVFPGKEVEGPFFATGISLITHMRNPHGPTVHMNLRYIEAGGTFWWGG